LKDAKVYEGGSPGKKISRKRGSNATSVVEVEKNSENNNKNLDSLFAVAKKMNEA